MSIASTLSKARAAADIDIAATVGTFEVMLDNIATATETAATAAVAALIAEHGPERAEALLNQAAALRKELEP
ncbi:hypothetical protein I5G60_gp77 [Mycobacterium phage Saguaro]|uniref:Uncharacterized protein n=1 Tax=Mycobacterium phage Saguaro TaxID=2315616 RepID=A0A386KA58_9CAUD|nr:hypothetical protein I5G60_gp77 [Mycobacterium phage Saguaro]AYD82069.1 hypothetical protein SEA_SAGUARO_77 [Mycobacterium phage Saguaro]